ncbi:MAG: hypothetical protein DRR16_06625 [Candidatus Parabeggiatoa sp. nov. 3]|nr:MAG: hypothetical protein DRR00_14365 [Gammaproteobacteria bacterium]RKZ61532.1 MAG: hypothetical protein DRQ99_20305 [Gammaproteobacteria bacterium]RKZ87743.1 MAG: hypothetical protein DRR16_06625 [Gammaproteobacteria bacterium]
MKSKRLLTALLSTVLIFSLSRAMATNVMVLESTPSDLLKKGQILTLKFGAIDLGNKKLVLAPKQEVKVIQCDSKILTLTRNNPKLPKLSQSTCNKLFALLSLDDFRPTQLPDGEDRGDDNTPWTLWMINISKSATYCVRHQKPELWRPETKRQAAKFSITHGEQSVTETWEAEKGLLRWPFEKISISDGGKYTVQLGNDEPKTLTLRLLPKRSTDAQKMMWMAENDCLDQARRLFKTGDWDE